MIKTTDDNFDDRLGDLDDIKAAIDAAADELSNAESCETPADFDASISEAIDAMNTALKALKALRS